MSLLDALLLLVIGTLAGFINVLSAGGSMLTLPLLMFLGLSPQVANGTNRVSITLQSVAATLSFLKAGARYIGLSLRLSVPAVIGSLLGAWLALQVSDVLFEWVLLTVMAGSAVLMLLPQPRLDTLPALGVFLYHDQVRWGYGLVLAAGSMLGAWLGVKVNISSRGALWVKWLTIVVIAAIIIRLLLG